MPKLKGKVAQANTLPLRRVRVRCAATADALADLQARVATQEGAISSICQALHVLAIERNARHARAAAALANVSAAAPDRAK